MSENQDTQAVEPEVNATQQPTEAQAAEQAQAVPENPAEPEKVEVTDVTTNALGQRESFDYKIDGQVVRTYGFQFPGTEKGVEIANLIMEGDRVAYYKALIKNLFTDPKVRAAGLDWFDEHKGLFEVMGAADTFLNEMLTGVRN